jgi:hypothetical protein
LAEKPHAEEPKFNRTFGIEIAETEYVEAWNVIV